MNSLNQILYEYNTAAQITEHFAYLIGDRFPITLGVNTTEFLIDEIIINQVADSGYIINLVSKLENVECREIYFALNLYSIELFTYLALKNIEFDYNTIVQD